MSMMLLVVATVVSESDLYCVSLINSRGIMGVDCVQKLILSKIPLAQQFLTLDEYLLGLLDSVGTYNMYTYIIPN